MKIWTTFRRLGLGLLALVYVVVSSSAAISAKFESAGEFTDKDWTSVILMRDTTREILCAAETMDENGSVFRIASYKTRDDNFVEIFNQKWNVETFSNNENGSNRISILLNFDNNENSQSFLGDSWGDAISFSFRKAEIVEKLFNYIDNSKTFEVMVGSQIVGRFSAAGFRNAIFDHFECVKSDIDKLRSRFSDKRQEQETNSRNQGCLKNDDVVELCKEWSSDRIVSGVNLCIGATIRSYSANENEVMATFFGESGAWAEEIVVIFPESDVNGKNLKKDVKYMLSGPIDQRIFYANEIDNCIVSMRVVQVNVDGF